METKYQNAVTLANHISKLSWGSTSSWTGCGVGSRGLAGTHPWAPPNLSGTLLSPPEPGVSVVSASPGILAAKLLSRVALMPEPLNHCWVLANKGQSRSSAPCGNQLMELITRLPAKLGTPSLVPSAALPRRSFSTLVSACLSPSSLWKPNSNATSSMQASMVSCPPPTSHKSPRSGSHLS